MRPRPPSRIAALRTSRLLSLWLALLLILLPVAVGCWPGALPMPPGGTVENPPAPPGSGPAPGTTPGQPAAPGPLLATSLRVHFLNVGQGDAVLIQSSPGGTALIDGGPRPAGEGLVAYLKAQGVKQIDLLVATHPHADHIGGLISVLGAFPVSRIIDSGMPHTSATFSDYLSAVETQVLAGGCVFETPEGQAAQLADNVTITVLGPESLANSANNSSVVCRLDFGSISFLFPGDAEEPAERALILAGKPLNADVLKVGHHGSLTSTSAAFLAAVSPAHAVISVGTNTFGHPSSITLSRLTSAGATVHRTDVAGHIVFQSDGQSLRVAAAQGVSAWLFAAAGDWLVAGAAPAATAQVVWGHPWP